jgi:hypothetical protein
LNGSPGTEFAALEAIMSGKARMSAILTAAAALVAVGCGQGGHGLSPSGGAARTPTVARAMTSWVTVQGDVWIPAIDALSGHLYQAERAFSSGSTATAAAELHGAAALLEDKAVAAGEETSSELQSTANELKAVGAELENGRPVSEVRFDRLLDRAWEADVSHGWEASDAAMWDQIVQEPNRLLELALARFDAGDREAASELLRKAAVIIQIEASRGENVVDREELVAARMDLREVASEIAVGEIQDDGRVGRVAARAAHALARHHQLLAEHEYQIGDSTTAGEELDTAVAYLERAYEWSETAMAPDTEAKLAHARAAATDSEMTGRPADEHLESELIAVNSEIDRLAATVVPPWLHADIG